MITATNLFFRRLASEWKYQYHVWKTVVDWIVALYIIVPFSAIFLNFYLSWWRKVPLGLAYIPLNVVLSIILIFTWSGTIRIFVEEADQLFLLQQKTWMSRIVNYSLGYSLTFNLLITSFFLLVLAPFLLLHYGFSLEEFVWLTLFTYGFKSSLGLVKQLVALRFQGWPQRLILFVLFIMTGVYLRQSVDFLLNRPNLFFLSVIVLLVALILLLFKRVNLQGAFFEDVSREQSARLKLASLFLRYAGTYLKKPKFFKKRPLLFKNSTLFFKERNPVNGLVELCLKTVLRNGGHVKFYLQLVGGCLLMILVFPPVWKWLLWFGFLILLTYVVWLYWQESFNSPFVSLFRWLPETKIAAASKALFLMSLPGQLILGLVVVLQTQAWTNSLVIFPLGIFTSYFTAKMLAALKS